MAHDMAKEQKGQQAWVVVKVLLLPVFLAGAYYGMGWHRSCPYSAALLGSVLLLGYYYPLDDDDNKVETKQEYKLVQTDKKNKRKTRKKKQALLAVDSLHTPHAALD
eukprot:8311577-Prorocentrum_lima.AAC.1